MVKLLGFTREDAIKFKRVFEIVDEKFINNTGKYYKYQVNDKEKIVYEVDGIYTVFSRENGKWFFEMFMVDQNYDIMQLASENYEISYEYGFPVFIENDTANVYSLRFVPRSNGPDIDGYTGIIVYVQYTPENDKRSIIGFQANYNEGIKNIILPYKLKDILYIEFESHYSLRKHGINLPNSYKNYILGKTECDTFSYNYLTIKEYGLFEFLKNGSYSLQREDCLRRYCKVIRELDNGDSLTFFPFARTFKKEDMVKKLNRIGHSIEVPEFFMDVFNGNYQPYDEYSQLAKEIQKLNATLEEKMILRLNLDEVNKDDNKS